MKNLLIPILLQLIGVAVIIAEVIIPSGGILAIIATGLLGYSIYLVFSGVSYFAGTIFIVVDMITLPIIIIIGLKMLAKSPLTLKKTLSNEDGVTSQPKELREFLDMEGITITDLRPSGMALINGRRVDVVSRGEYIDNDIKIYVSDVTGNQIIVREIDNL